MEILNTLDLKQNAAINVVIHALSVPPGSPVDKQYYYNTSVETIFVYRAADSTWVPVGAGTVVGGAGLGESVTAGVVTLSVNVDNTTLEVNTDVVRVKDGGIVSSKLATDAVTAAKIIAGAVDFSKIQNIPTMSLIGRTAAGTGVVSAITLINDSSLTTASATNIATAGAIKAYVDAVAGGIGQLVGGFNAAFETAFPTGAFGGSVSRGDYWHVTGSGTVNGVKLNIGDVMIANKDLPSPTNAADWLFLESNRDQATATILGMVFLATSSEVQTGTDANKAVTPAGLSARTATESRTGLIEIATQAEVNAGTDDTRAVTSLKMATYVASLVSGGSYAAVIGDGSALNYTVTHGLASSDVSIDVYDNVTGSTVYPDTKRVTAGTVQILFSRAPGMNTYKVVIKK